MTLSPNYEPSMPHAASPYEPRNQEYLRSLERRVLDHPVLQHPLVRAFGSGTLSFEQVRRFGLLYYPHIQRTRLYQAAALSISLDEPLQWALASILADEFACIEGRVEPSRTHPAIYRQFLRALGYSETDWADPPIIPELKSYIETHYALCARHHPLTAIGCAGLAMEWPIPPLYRRLVAGLRRFDVLDDHALELFLGHIDIDIEHGQMIRTALEPHLDEALHREHLERGIFESLDARYRLMTGLERAII